MLHYITKIIDVKPFQVVCEFNTNEKRVIDFTEKIKRFNHSSSTLMKKLGDESFFKTVQLDSYGTLIWGDEIDFCPDVLYAESKSV